ncbi:sodium:solute symporter family protein [Alkalitalea saponilacus]|uniref:Solute:Na+ symporter, SSS family n=1 Tax=Alkalitalea saponilacus TaxID=889453 RepID=A0A1T5HTY6_9BACT|nr:sodium:solute symporter family protein [Alkalitalea saponilacus]ASB50189.1 sodium:solute symporter [Alkalitalea saponilacus]SKC23960.1 solute:Na+ symporter, SSS family [Alkalitalea saponilacus]
MHIIDLIIIVLYFTIMLFIGFWFHRKNNNTEDYFVGSRKMTRWHLGLSVVATDVGGGFSIGLGGLGFVMGLSGSWILFTGLIGAWLTAVILIPKVHKIGVENGLQTFPEILKYNYGRTVALVAAVISAIGYMGFTASQVLAGAKLTSATFVAVNMTEAVIIMGAIAVVYTALGGIKAVIYTDTAQWIILLSGLSLVGVPFALHSLGGWEAAKVFLTAEMLQLTNVKFTTIINWAFSIIPIWFIGMTLYQRIFAAKSAKEAKKAWYIAGVFEYPFMAFLGVFLGMLAKAAFGAGIIPEAEMAMADNESAMPLMLKHVLPIGALGLIMAAYFSAILSTADSCLMAASGNISRDLFNYKKSKNALKVAQWMTLVIGIAAISVALYIPSVLDLMLLSYAFMVCGLVAPVLGFIIYKKPSPIAAIAAMITGSSTLLIIQISGIKLPYELDAVVPGLLLSLLVMFVIQIFKPEKEVSI